MEAEDALAALEAELAREERPAAAEGQGSEVAPTDELDDLQTELIELTSPRAEDEIDVAAMVAGSGASATASGLASEHDPNSPEPQRMEAYDTDELQSSIDGLSPRWTTSQDQELIHATQRPLDGLEREPQVYAKGATVDVSIDERQEQGLTAPAPTESAQAVLLRSAGLSRRPWSELYKACKYRVHEGGSPAVLGLHQDHVSLEYSEDPTHVRHGTEQKILFTDIRSWRSHDDEIVLELQASNILRLSCEDTDIAEFIAHELAHLTTTAHAIARAITAQSDADANSSEMTKLQRRVSELQAGLEIAQEMRQAESNTTLQSCPPSESGSNDLTARLAEAEEKLQNERLRTAKLEEDLKSVREAYTNTLAELHQVTKQYDADLNKRASTTVGPQEQDDAVVAAAQQPTSDELAQVRKHGTETQQGVAGLHHESKQAAESSATQLDEAQRRNKKLLAVADHETQVLADELARARDECAKLQSQLEESKKAAESSATQLAEAQRREQELLAETQVLVAADREKQVLGTEELEGLRAQLDTIQAEAATNAAKASDAEARCIGLTASLADAEGQIKSLQEQPSQAELAVSGELVKMKTALAAEVEARNALRAEHQVELQVERQRALEAQKRIQSLRSSLSVSPDAVHLPVDLDAKMQVSKSEQQRLEEAVKAVSADAEAQQRAYVELQFAHTTLVRQHIDILERFDAELGQWLELSAQAEQQHRSEAELSTVLMHEVEQWLALSEQMKSCSPDRQQEAIIRKLREDFSDLQVDHEMEIAKIERDFAAQTRELSSASEKVLRAQATRGEVEKIAIEDLSSGKYAEEHIQQAYTRAEHKAMIAHIFGFCDATGSGVLNQNEYKLYLEATGAWGTPPRVDDKFNAQWIVECTRMGCDHEVGITLEAFERHLYGEDFSSKGTQQIKDHLDGVKRIFRARLAEIQQDNAEMRESIEAMISQHRSQVQADKHEAEIERTRRLTAEAEIGRLTQECMDAELSRVVELGVFAAVCEAETHEKATLTIHSRTQAAARYSSEQLTLQERLDTTKQELSGVVLLKSEAEAAAKDLHRQLQAQESKLTEEGKTRQIAEATVESHAATIEELRVELEATQKELAATIEAAKAEQGTVAAKFAQKDAELAVAMARVEGKLGVVATERNAALQTVSLHEKRLAEKEADFARAAQEEAAALHAKLKLADQRLDRVSRHTATLVENAKAEEKKAWTEEKRNLMARLKAQEMEMDHVLTVKISSLQEQLTSTVVAVETRAAGVELALREKLEQEQTSAKAAQALADAEISRLAGLLDTAERTLLNKVPVLESALSKAERDTHRARAAHATDRAEVLDQHAAAIAAAEHAKASLQQESSERIAAVMAQASESTASLSSEFALKASQWDEDRRRLTTQLDTINSKLDTLQMEYDQETVAHNKCKLLLVDKERTVASLEEAAKHMGALLRKAIDEKTASSAALAEQTAAWSTIKSDLTRERDVALKECDGLIKRLKSRHAEQLAEVNARNKEEMAFAKVEQDGLRARLGQKDLAHSKTVTELEATLRKLTHERDMACVELRRRNSMFSKEREKLIADRDASRTQADEAEVSSALAAQQLYEIGTELSTERIESRRAKDALRTEMLQSEHRLRSLLVESERNKQKWAADATWLESSAEHIQQESARRVAAAELRADGAETRLFEFIGQSADLLNGKTALSTIEDVKNRRKQEQGGLWVFIKEDDELDLGSDERLRSPLPEVTPREIPLQIAALEEVDEGVPPEDPGSVVPRDYSYSRTAETANASHTSGATSAMETKQESPRLHQRLESEAPTQEDTL